MPRLTRFFIRSALACLVLGVLIPALVQLRDVLGLPPRSVLLLPAALHLVVVGFLTQLVFGVALWMFPRASGEPREPGALAWAVFACLNVGLVLRVVAEPLAGTSDGTVVGAALMVSALLQWVAAIGFAIVAWPRVRAR